jgi:hypothetical protein
MSTMGSRRRRSGSKAGSLMGKSLKISTDQKIKIAKKGNLKSISLQKRYYICFYIAFFISKPGNFETALMINMIMAIVMILIDRLRVEEIY